MRSAAQRDVLRVVMNKAHNSYESEYATPTIELGLWLRALKSFFDLDNLPLSETERGAILKRDFTCEVNITRAVLLRCLNLIGKLSQQESLPHAYDENEAVAPDVEWPGGAARIVVVPRRERPDDVEGTERERRQRDLAAAGDGRVDPALAQVAQRLPEGDCARGA